VAVSYRDYYKILGVPKTADAKAIKQAYRKLARKYHPDQNPGNAGAAERFKEINEANEVLSDPDKRRRYDELGADWARYADSGGFGGRAGGPGGGFRVHVDQTGELGDFSEFFRTFFGDLGGRASGFEEAGFERGGPFRTGSRGRRGGDLETEVEITLEEAFAGTRRAVEFQQLGSCDTCRGSGRQGSKPCPTCGGAGQVSRSHRLEVKIPAGVRDGSRVRAAGEGGVGTGGGTRGDLYLRVRVAPHPVFERREDDLHVELPLAVWEAALGAEVEVPTLRGKVAMKIPPETGGGRTFRLPGYGVPHVKGGRGDQYVRVRLVPPKDLTPRERALFEELRQLRPQSPRE
jgi:molecular chaperone DnaJ/curved DNA-binding protein